MKLSAKKIKLLAIGTLFVATAFIFIPKILLDKKLASKIEKKYGPADFFYFQRSFPGDQFPYKTYLELLENESQLVRSEKNNESAAWRLEGPANIGGRINVVVAHPDNDQILYVGCVAGGIFKTTDGGLHWNPIFDQYSYLSIGTLTLDPVNPDIIYAGTGDPNIGAYVFVGNGVYRSSNGGETWEHLGLEEVGIVSKIAVNPQNTNEIYVSAMGLPFVRNNDRGLYKSTNGGQTWEQILFVSDNAGIIDMVMDPQSPEIIYAASWNRIRNNHESFVTGPDAHIYRTTNGGTDWEILTSGLPEGEFSRIGLTINKNNSNQLLAIYVGTDLETHGIYQTNNAGQTWSEVSTSSLPGDELGGFGWYFAKIRINPFNPQQFFLLGVDLYRTDNQGQNWQMSGPIWYTYEFHADKHDLIFIDENSIIVSTDGGLYRSDDGGENFTDIENIPNTQFYRIAINPNNPGFYAGGAQDNGTSYGNYLETENWIKIFGGDGFQPVFHPSNPNIMYVETQNGGLRFSEDAFSEDGWFDDFTMGIQSSDRRSWDMPLIMSPHDPGTLFTGTYRVYKISNSPNGQWNPISPDLTEGTASRYHVITSLSQSAINAGLIYTGASDGYVHRTLNGGTNWDNISTNLPVHYVTGVYASPSVENRVYVSHSGYRENEYVPHLHLSENNGDTWQDISGDLPQFAVNRLLIIPGEADTVLFVATDGGVYHTFNGGTNWLRTGISMPVIPVYDLAFEPVNRRVIAGTHARSMMSISLDSLRPQPQRINQHFNGNKLRCYVSNGDIHIISHESLSGANITLVDAAGKTILRENLSQTNHKISCNGLPSGIYFINLTKGGQKLSQKIIL